MTLKEKINNARFRPSQIGRLMTNLPVLTGRQIEEKLKLEAKEKLTELQEKKLKELTKKTLPENDQLPDGAITYIYEVFDKIYNNREAVIENDYMDKGNYCEEDCLKLLSDVTGNLLIKNRILFVEENIEGTPDNVFKKRNDKTVIDTKAPWSLNTFRNAEFKSIYEWQIKGYCYLTGSNRGKLAYCLVNAPAHLIMKQKERYYYRYGCDEESEELKEAYENIERNMIFDIKKFKKDNPGYDMTIKDWKYDIHPKQRVKMFDVDYTEEDEKNIKRRLKMAKAKLIEIFKEEERKKKAKFII